MNETQRHAIPVRPAWTAAILVSAIALAAGAWLISRPRRLEGSGPVATKPASRPATSAAPSTAPQPLARLYRPAVSRPASQPIPAWEGPAPSLEQLVDLQKAGKDAMVVAGADAALRASPASAKLIRWRVSFNGYGFHDAILGKTHAWFMIKTRGGGANRPDLPDNRPQLRYNTMGYDWWDFVTCVDLKTGKKLWTRQCVGEFRYVVDPKSDDLWASAAKIFQLAADTGEVVSETSGPAEWRQHEGLVVGGEYLVHRNRFGTGRQPTIKLFDVEKRQTKTVEYDKLLSMSPREDKFLNLGRYMSPSTNMTEVSVHAPGGTALWSYKVPGYSANAPVWLGDDVLLLSGTPDTKAIVHRFDGRTGELKWKFEMPHGAYSAEQVYLPGNSHLYHEWEALGMVGAHIVAIGGDGGLSFLDPATGQLKASHRISKGHFVMPRILDDMLIIASIDELYALSRDVLFGSAPASEHEIRIVQARSLVATGQLERAAALLDEVLRAAPEAAPAWGARALWAQAMNRPLDEVGALVNQMRFSGQSQSEPLRRRYGLIRRIPTGPITAPLAPIGDCLYAGTWNGELLRIDGRTGEVLEKLQMPTDIKTMYIKNDLLVRYGTDRREVAIVPSGTSLDHIPPADPLRAMEDVAGAPSEWYTRIGYDGRVVKWRGKHYRPLHKGHVRIFDGQSVKTFNTTLEPIERWNICLSPARPLGYGSGGVYELDENLCPVKKLVDVGLERLNKRPWSADLAASDGKTICLLTYNGEEHVLQIWTRDGAKKLREQTVLAPAFSGPAPDLAPLNGGYFYAGGELAWLPPDPAAPSWRFGAGAQSRQEVPRPGKPRVGSFGAPRIIADHLFTPNQDGGVYIFDLRHFGRAN